MTMAIETRPARRPAAVLLARAACVLAAGVLVTACAVSRQAEKPQLPAPVVEPIPLTVGVHYTLGFRMARPISGFTLWKIGDASVALFDAALGNVFAEVVPVDPWPAGARGLAVAGVIVPEVIGVASGWDNIRIRYGIDVYSTQGKRIAGWEVEGRWANTPGANPQIFGDPAFLREAMRAAGAALVASFYGNPHARSWLEANGVSPGKPK